MSVRTGVGAEARVKRKMVSNAGPSTPSKTPRRTANFDTVALLSPTSCLSCLASLVTQHSIYFLSKSIGSYHQFLVLKIPCKFCLIR